MPPEGESRGLRASFDDLRLSGAVEVRQCRRREHAVGEERPAGEGGPVRGVEGVLRLVERAGLHVGAATLQRPDAHGGLDRMSGLIVRCGISDRREPLEVPRGAEGLIAADGRIAGVTGADKDRVVRTAVRRGDRRRRVDRHPELHGPAAHRGAVGEMKGVDRSARVSDHHRPTTTVEGRDVGRRLLDRRTTVVEDLAPLGRGRPRRIAGADAGHVRHTRHPVRQCAHEEDAENEADQAVPIFKKSDHRLSWSVDQTGKVYVMTAHDRWSLP